MAGFTFAQGSCLAADCTLRNKGTSCHRFFLLLDKEDGGASAALIAGVSSGAVAVTSLAILVLVAFYLLKKRRESGITKNEGKAVIFSQDSIFQSA